MLIHLSYKQKEAGPWRSEYPSLGVVDVRLMNIPLRKSLFAVLGKVSEVNWPGSEVRLKKNQQQRVYEKRQHGALEDQQVIENRCARGQRQA